MGRQRMVAPVLLSVGMCLLLYVAMPVSGTADGGRVALESTKERIARLEDEAKAKTIEARIRQTAAQLENEHAEQEKSASVADQSRKGAIDDKHEAEDDFAKAKELSSSSVREEQEARLERHRAQSAEKVLSLKTRVASLLKSRAQDEDRRASTAQQEVNKVKSRVQAVRDEIARLERQAKIKSVEADERVSVGQRLLSSAKKLSVKAKALQEEHLQKHQITGKLVVSNDALQLMMREARRVGHLLQIDSDGLQNAENLVKSLPAQPDHPLQTMDKRMDSTSHTLKRLAKKRPTPVYVDAKNTHHKNTDRPTSKHNKGS